MQDPASFFGSEFGRIGVSVTANGVVRTSGVFAPPPAPSAGGSHLSGGAIAGAVIGSIVGFALLVAAVVGAVLWYTKYR